MIIAVLPLLLLPPFIVSSAHGSSPAKKLVSAKKLPVVALVERESMNARRGYFCNGVLLRPRVVLTAAHCLRGLGARRIDVVYRRSDLRRSGGRRVSVLKTRKHPSVRVDGIGQDLALMRLESRLRVRSLSLGQIKDDYRMRIASWAQGYRLRTFSATTIPSKSCQIIYGGVFFPAWDFCTESKRAATCSGDSGAPLFNIESSGRVVVYGIVSRGEINCQRFPSINARADRSWIKRGGVCSLVPQLGYPVRMWQTTCSAAAPNNGAL
jgi:secreted trypsin-like serine protease